MAALTPKKASQSRSLSSKTFLAIFSKIVTIQNLEFGFISRERSEHAWLRQDAFFVSIDFLFFCNTLDVRDSRSFCAQTWEIFDRDAFRKFSWSKIQSFLFSIQHCNYLLRATSKRSPSYFATNEMILIVCGSRSLTSHAKVSFRLFFSLGVTSFPSACKINSRTR